ncbi:hypothetical protein BH23CHL5_BH23CHL5_15440 [soil metagenome]
MAEVAKTMHPDALLDREFDLSRISIWSTVAIIVVAIGACIRFVKLDGVALSFDESKRAFHALSVYDGRPLGNGMQLPETSPAMLLGQAAMYFLFGTTDGTARVIAAISGAAIIALAFSLRKFVGARAAMGMGIAVAFSPTLVYSSRIATPEALVAVFTMLSIVAFLHVGACHIAGQSALIWSIVFGVVTAGMLASGPISISVLLAMAVGFGAAALAEPREGGAVRSSITAVRGRVTALGLALGFVVTLLIFFSRGFSSLSALGGISTTFSDWARLVSTDSSATPTQFFVIAILLYELVFVIGAVAGSFAGSRGFVGGVSPVFFLGWFVTLLIIFSFSAGRSPEQAIHVALPLVLMGGAGIASLIEAIGWSHGQWKRSALLVLTMVGLVGAIAAFISRVSNDESGSSLRTAFELFAVLIIAVVPLTIAAMVLINDKVGKNPRVALRTAGLVLTCAVIVFTGLFAIRSTVMLSYFRADTSLELLAQRTSTPAIGAFIRQVNHLSRDLTVRETSAQDPTGGHGISIALESNVEWPFRWYFRDYPDVRVVEAGAGVSSGADLVVARESAGMDNAGLTPRLIAGRNRVPPEYVAPSFGNVLQAVLFPARWEAGMNFLLFRTGITKPDAEPIAAGYGSRLSQKLFPSTGPYTIYERVGTGSGRGQFNQPRGVGVNLGDGSIYVVDSANGRVQRFEAGGGFSGAWGGPETNVTFTVTAEGLGPTGIEVGFDGLIHVADTWGHRIVVLNADGQVVREFGAYGDTMDAPDASTLTGLFFGPRDVAITGTEIYVVDTGNERVQVFTPDGTFIRSWGGYGSEPTQFIEPVGIAVGPDDRVYVADSGNARISVFARDGTPLMQWPAMSWQGQLYFEPYLAFDQFGRLYATSSATGSVDVYSLDGELIQSLFEAGGEQFEAPVGIALGTDGTMKVTDRGRSAVLQIPIQPEELPEVGPDGELIGSPVPASPVPLEASPQASPASPVASPEASPE